MTGFTSTVSFSFKLVKSYIEDFFLAKGKANVELQKHVITNRIAAYSEASATLPIAFSNAWGAVTSTFVDRYLTKSLINMRDEEKAELFDGLGFSDRKIAMIASSTDQDAEFERQCRRHYISKSADLVAELNKAFNKHSLVLPTDLFEKLNNVRFGICVMHNASHKKHSPSATPHDKSDLDHLRNEYELKANWTINTMTEMFREHNLHSIDRLI